MCPFTTVDIHFSLCCPPKTNLTIFFFPTPFFIQSEYKCCTACDDPISDRYILEVSGHAWHGSCLRCCVCLATFDQQTTCFVRDDQIYCKEDYLKWVFASHNSAPAFGHGKFKSINSNYFHSRLFNRFTQCAKCQRKITSTDWIRRAKHFVFHLACFSCDSCDRQLSTGEEFALIQDQILCREHYLETVEGETTSSDADSYFGGDDSSKKKIKRVRTAFTEEQLEVLQRNFEIDSNPDGQDLERIALNAGLSKRVTQVWFQNARARQKKHSYLGKRKGWYWRQSTDRTHSLESFKNSYFLPYGHYHWNPVEWII